MNQSAVALAADSAVTIGRGERIFETANKLFTLSKYAPVGVMFYDNASSVGVPWETAVKTFRGELGQKRFSTLEEYAGAFVAYLSSHVNWFPQAHQERNIRRVAQLTYIGIADQAALLLGQSPGLADRIRGSGTVATPELAALTTTATQWHTDAQNLPRLPGLSPQFEANFTSAYAGVLQQARQGTFGSAPLGGLLEGLLDEVARLRHTQRWFSDDNSGIVIAGFGDDELFPRLRSYTLEYVVANELRMQPGLDFSVELDPSQATFIVPFAQSDEMYSFVLGSNPNLQKHVRGMFDKHLTCLATDAAQAALGLLASIPPSVSTQLTNLVAQRLKQFEDEMQQHRMNATRGPFIGPSECSKRRIWGRWQGHS